MTGTLPLWAQWVQALGVPMVGLALAAVGACLARQQVRIARAKLQHDLFEKRYLVYAAARKFLAQIESNPDVFDDELREYFVGTNDAVFLFDDDLANYLDNLRKAAINYRTANKATDSERGFLVGEQRNKAIQTMAQQGRWFTDHLAGLRDRFKPFLKLQHQETRLSWWRKSR